MNASTVAAAAGAAEAVPKASFDWRPVALVRPTGYGSATARESKPSALGTSTTLIGEKARAPQRRGQR